MSKNTKTQTRLKNIEKYLKDGKLNPWQKILLEQIKNSPKQDLEERFIYYWGTTLGADINNLPYLDTSSVTDLSNFFKDCDKLRNVPNWDTSNVIHFSHCFENSSLSDYNCNWDLSNGKYFDGMFWNCGCETLYFNKNDFKNVRSAINCFYNNSLQAIEGLNIDYFETASDTYGLFFNIRILTDVTWKNFTLAGKRGVWFSDNNIELVISFAENITNPEVRIEGCKIAESTLYNVLDHLDPNVEGTIHISRSSINGFKDLELSESAEAIYEKELRKDRDNLSNWKIWFTM